MAVTELELLEAQALGLPKPQRVHLLDKLIASLDVDDEIEAAWTPKRIAARR
ncbi:MAG: hypothetical protein QM778_39295 [Myxococcales bacterium]